MEKIQKIILSRATIAFVALSALPFAELYLLKINYLQISI